jgi:hypothetical protein
MQKIAKIKGNNDQIGGKVIYVITVIAKQKAILDQPSLAIQELCDIKRLLIL